MSDTTRPNPEQSEAHTPPNPYVTQNPYVAPAAQVPPPYVPAPYTPAPYTTAGVAYAYAPRTSALAITSMVLSLVGLLTWITAIGGVVTGHIALGQIKRTGEGGKGMAITGLVVGYVLIGFGVLYILFFAALFGTMWFASGP